MQGSLFSENAYESAPATLARAEDPVESKLAAAQVAPTVGEKQAWTAECVRQSPGRTAMELARLYCPDDPRRIGRRLGECVKRGLVKHGEARPCSITKKRAMTWLPV